MVDELKEIANAFTNPAMRHAIFGHMPIALSVLLIPLTVLSAALPNNLTLRVTTIAAFVVLLVATFLTLNSGELANAAINRALPQHVYDLIHEHEEIADKLWLFAIAGLGLTSAAGLVRKTPWRVAASALAAAVAIAGALWTAVTAHLGGTLVYEHGVGTTPMAIEAQPRAIAPEDENRDERVAFFRDQVVPILKSQCFQCHNPAKVAAKKSGGFDQTTREALMKGGASGPAVVPGDPDGSLLIQRVRGDDPDERLMPPPPDDPLTAEQIAILEKWIRDGAAWGE